jgi:hypothetical protein
MPIVFDLGASQPSLEDISPSPEGACSMTGVVPETWGKVTPLDGVTELDNLATRCAYSELAACMMPSRFCFQLNTQVYYPLTLLTYLSKIQLSVRILEADILAV